MAQPQPWYRMLFSHPRAPDLASTRTQAEQGDAEAQFFLGVCCSSAKEGPLDLAQAAQWYRKAADQNHGLAQLNLGLMLAQGQGLPKDDAAAGMWIRRAAEGGDAGAQFNLGARCHRASVSLRKAGSQELLIEAYKWFNLAAAQGYAESASCHEQLTVGMSRDEVAEGNRRVAGFVAAKTNRSHELAAA